MERTFQCFPDGKFFTIQELETHLKFHYLPSIAFATPAEQEDIQQRGLEKWKNNGVSKESQKLGHRFMKEIEAFYLPDVSIRYLNEKLGYGLFSEETLDVGCYVGEYAGLIRKNDRRYLEPLNHYCYEYPVPDHIGRSFVIDATNGSLTRFINHSFTPNLKPVHVFYNGFYHLIFLAMQRIEKGTQLCYDYGQNYWYVRDRPISLS